MSFGRLERSAQPAPMSEINMTPMIDVMLVLLVIFMLAAPLLVSAVHLDLPVAASAGASQAPRLITLTLQANGQTLLDANPATADELQRALALAARQNPATELSLRADAAVPYGRVVEIMGVAQNAGLRHIGFVALRKP